MLIRVFLHAEFISAMKTVQNPIDEKCKKRKMNNFGNFLIEENIRKSQKLFFRWKRRQIKQNQNFSNFEKSALSIAYDKIGGNYALSANSTKICTLGYFYMQNSYLR